MNAPLLRSLSPASAHRLFVSLGCLGLALRAALALCSYGTNDTWAWALFAQKISDGGVCHLYHEIVAYNHPPLIGYVPLFGLWLSKHTALPFFFWLKLPGVLAECLSAYLIYVIWRARAGARTASLVFAAFGWSLVSILVAGYHGNTDAIAAALSCLAAYWQDKERPLRSGLAAAAAMNVKLIPLLMVPALLVRLRTVRAATRFALGLVAGLVPMGFLGMRCGKVFVRNVLQYNSQADNWGISFFLQESAKSPPFMPWAVPWFAWYKENGRYVILLTILLVCLVYRIKQALQTYEICALSFVLFLALTPGFGVQYLIYPVPLLFAYRLRPAARYALFAGLFAASIYLAFKVPEFPWKSMFSHSFPMPAPLVGLIPWWILVRFVWINVARTVRSPPGLLPAAGLAPELHAPGAER